MCIDAFDIPMYILRRLHSLWLVSCAGAIPHIAEISELVENFISALHHFIQN